MPHLLLNVLSILWQMPHMLMYYNDWFYICKDLMEGEINYNYNYYAQYKIPSHQTILWTPTKIYVVTKNINVKNSQNTRDKEHCNEPIVLKLAIKYMLA